MSDSDKRVAAALQEARLFEVRCHARYYLTRNGACSPAGAHARTNARKHLRAREPRTEHTAPACMCRCAGAERRLASRRSDHRARGNTRAGGVQRARACVSGAVVSCAQGSGAWPRAPSVHGVGVRACVRMRVCVCVCVRECVCLCACVCVCALRGGSQDAGVLNPRWYQTDGMTHARTHTHRCSRTTRYRSSATSTTRSPDRAPPTSPAHAWGKPCACPTAAMTRYYSATARGVNGWCRRHTRSPSPQRACASARSCA
jgi:hypothetical protein